MWSTRILGKSRNSCPCLLLAQLSQDASTTFRNVLVLSKRTRYELEKSHNPGLRDDQMEQYIRRRGSDYDRIIKHHNIHKEFHKKLIESLSRAKYNVETVSMTDYSSDVVEWADLIIPAGGDGTFLLGASKIFTSRKPVVGFNSDPSRSEGFLCLPAYYSTRIDAAVQKILKKEFTWQMRSRIQIKITAMNCSRAVETLCRKSNNFQSPQDADIKTVTEVIPYLALNEVFIGESLSSQVSYLDVNLGKYPRTTVKCSGLCVSTGTGSTSWHLSINRLSENKVRRILEIAGVNGKNVKEITKAFNDSLTFRPDDPRMYYTLRDLIVIGVLPLPPGLPPGDLLEGPVIAYSKCSSADLVIDGGRSYSFNDGSKAELAIQPENALRTIVLK